MSVNSTFADFSLDAPHLSSNSSLPVLACYKYRTTYLILTAFSFTTTIVLFPVFALVSFVGYQRWKQRRSVSKTATATTSHSDLFTFHLVAMEVIAISASFFICVGTYIDVLEMTEHGLDVFGTTWCVKIQFHTLTCVERYLAVVHPVTYLSLKRKGGVRIRNISIGCVWLLCVVWAGPLALTDIDYSVLFFCSVAFASVVVCFCSISVLRALKRPGPGKVGKDGERVDQMKRRAFNTIVSITGVLFLCLGGMLVCNALKESQLLSSNVGCAVMTSAVWFSLPSSLVLPLLFLHRAGKLPGSKV